MNAQSRGSDPICVSAERREGLLDARWFLAARRGDVPTLLEWLARGAEVDARDEYARTALMLAVDGEHAEAVEVLLSRGADPNAECSSGPTPMTWAALQARG